MFSSFQAALDKMAKGHMLADVVAIIGKKVIIVQEFSFRRTKIFSLTFVKMQITDFCVKLY